MSSFISRRAAKEALLLLGKKKSEPALCERYSSSVLRRLSSLSASSSSFSSSSSSALFSSEGGGGGGGRKAHHNSARALLTMDGSSSRRRAPSFSFRGGVFSSPRTSITKTQRRAIFIQTQSTPNPSSLMFLPGKPVLGGEGEASTSSSSMNFSNARESMRSPLAKKLFQIDGVTGVFFGKDFVTVTKSEAFDWDVLKPEVYAKIMDFYASGEPVVDVDDGSSSSSSSNEEDVDDPNKILDTDSETVAMIKELLETRIKPAVAEDGGDIAFKKFDEADGLVYVELRGACDGCPSSTVTLKSGIENMLMHYVPEVKGVVPWEGDKEMDLLDMADLMRGR